MHNTEQSGAQLRLLELLSAAADSLQKCRESSCALALESFSTARQAAALAHKKPRANCSFWVQLTMPEIEV